ncbi:SulP family inorganic anion transporter [Lentisphaerota bacterium ZTH]|nr:sodium-independent anion transporter [Lentisphaerota bacterium]WET07314.1 SulP family inorganic anion transporter [Lentisphaerota bacterium ZTH]
MNRENVLNFFPFLRLFPIRTETLKPDIQAGLIIAMVLVPQSMAYAELAGLPPQYGLYCSIIPCIIAALWGSSAHLSTGPVAMISLVVATTLGGLARPGSSYYIQLAQGSCLIAGVFFILFSIFRLDKLIRKIDRAVIKGFTSAAAIIIILSQLNKIIGFDLSDLAEYDQLFNRLSPGILLTIAAGGVALWALFMLKKLFPRSPSVLIVIIAAALSTLFINRLLQHEVIATVGHIPAGLPKFGVPAGLTWGDYIKLIPGGLVIAVLGTLEVYSISSTIAEKTGQQLNFRQEFLGQGLACLGGGFSAGYPGSGSFSRSALAYSSGGRTALTSITAGLSVLVVLLFFSGLLSYLPRFALAAVIISAVYKLIDFRICTEFWHDNRRSLISFIVTFGTTLIFQDNIIMCIIIGILTSQGLKLVAKFVKAPKMLKSKPGLLQHDNSCGI